ncbi:DUF7344 domain-containing protein [Natronobeatus ordinarius]|uniref:DUF7344 domain-containing protein n=1 Tax=Natronobeatus ordinarius TaxID=2963433 RepID=UPI0020CDB362|nr:hypothetical protein [Natronobeatus ordinarius]
MTVHNLETREEISNTIFTALASEQRRLVIDIVGAQSSPVDERELATYLAARERDIELGDVTREDRRRALATLRHRVLPELEAARLVERRDDGVTMADHPTVGHATIGRLLEADPPDDVLRALANGRRRDVYAILTAEGPSIDRRTLARTVAAREYDVDPVDVPDQEVEDVLVTLHHVHLPALEDAGLLEYDLEVGRVSFNSHQALEDATLEADESVTVILASA